MKKNLQILIFLSLASTINLHAQQHKGAIGPNAVPPVSMHYMEEYTCDSTTDAAAWRQQQPGLHASFATTNRLYFRTEVPQLDEKKTKLAGQRLERRTAEYADPCLVGGYHGAAEGAAA